MSLVSYADSSGESSGDESDSETTPIPAEPGGPRIANKALDKATASLGNAAKFSHSAVSSQSKDDGSHNERQNLASMLPEPKKANPTIINVTKLDKTVISNQPETDASSSGGLKLASKLPKPKEANPTASLVSVTNSKGSIKISIPELPSVDSDSEEESAEPKRKRFQPAKSTDKPRSGLFAKLPAPMNSAGAGKGMAKSFLPYVFSKPKKENAAKVNKQDAGSGNGVSAAEGTLSIAEIRRRSAQAAAKILTEQKTKKSTEEEEDSDEDSAVSFFSYVEKAPEPEGEIENLDLPDMDLAPVSIDDQEPSHEEDTLDYAPPVHNIHYENKDTPHAPSQSSLPGAVGPTNDSVNEAILRLQGKRRRKEEITFVDIRADDALEGNKELLLKSISEEKSMNRTSHSKKRNTGMPSGQQKRKHQLSYLVHQAKARDLELRNTWAQNRATRQQTQAKYGF